VLLYDAECRLCRFTARCVARLDRHRELALLPLQDAAAQPLLADLDEDQQLRTWRLAQPDGFMVGYGAGIPELLASMRPTRPLGRVLRLAPERVLEGLYHAIVRNRGSLGRFVPDGPAPRRYP